MILTKEKLKKGFFVEFIHIFILCFVTATEGQDFHQVSCFFLSINKHHVVCSRHSTLVRYSREKSNFEIKRRKEKKPKIETETRKGHIVRSNRGTAFDYLSKDIIESNFFSAFVYNILLHTLIMHAFLSTNFCLNDILNIWTVHRGGQCCCSIVGPSYTEKNTCQSRHNLLCFRFTSSFARFFSFSLSWLLGFGSNGVLVAVHLALLNALMFSVRKVNKKSVLFRTFFRHWNELALCYINSNHTSPRAKKQKKSHERI